MLTFTASGQALFEALPQFLGFALAGLLAHALGLWALRRVLRAAGDSFWESALALLRAPTRLAILLLALQFAHAATALPESVQSFARKSFALGWIAALAWIILALGGVLGLWIQRTYDIRSEDNLKARRILTKVRVFQRLFAIVVGVLALAGALMIFDATRGIGASVLASAGILGAVVGLSSQKILGTVFAGVQLALTQPIRLDDVVVVEGEWGRIEEITMTYVVVHIWDERRLVVPVTYFLDRPIQNWTRSSAEILGTVFLHLDHRAPVPALREELARICREEAGELWDGRVCGLQVTEAGPDSLTVRALVSSADSSSNWDLRCLVRERLLCYVQENHPQALPQTRVLLHATGREAVKEHDDG
jgi:small-conductance mechanosensitive channel